MSDENNVVRVEQNGDNCQIVVPAYLHPQLYRWTGKLQQELDKPIDIADVVAAYVLAEQQVISKAMSEGLTDLWIREDEFLEVMKEEASQILKLRTNSTLDDGE